MYSFITGLVQVPKNQWRRKVRKSISVLQIISWIYVYTVFTCVCGEDVTCKRCRLHEYPNVLVSLNPHPLSLPVSGSSSASESDDEADVAGTALEDLQKATGMTLGASIPDALSKAKQSRGEKKARKVGVGGRPAKMTVCSTLWR